MSENEFNFKDRKFVAVVDGLDDPGGCALCAFDAGADITGCVYIHRPPCSGPFRKDKTDIHWEEVE